MNETQNETVPSSLCVWDYQPSESLSAPAAVGHVRFPPKADKQADASGCPLSAKADSCRAAKLLSSGQKKTPRAMVGPQGLSCAARITSLAGIVIRRNAKRSPCRASRPGVRPFHGLASLSANTPAGSTASGSSQAFTIHHVHTGAARFADRNNQLV